MSYNYIRRSNEVHRYIEKIQMLFNRVKILILNFFATKLIAKQKLLSIKILKHFKYKNKKYVVFLTC